MTQDTDDLLAQVFSVMPTANIEGQTEIAKEEREIDFNVRRVSNAFQDFIERSGVVETETHERHTESHFHVETHVESHREVHHESHHEVVISGGVQVHREEHNAEFGQGVTHSIGHGLAIDHHEEESHGIGHGVTIDHQEEETHEVGHGISLGSTEMNPPETHHEHFEQHEEQHFGIGQGAVPHTAAHDDDESVVSVGTHLSAATSISVHSSVSQKSAQIFADAPVIVKISSRHSDASHKSSVVPESHHSQVAHTHDRESTISINSAKSSSSTFTGSEASKNTAIEKYVFAEKADGHHEHEEGHHHHHRHEHGEGHHHHEIHHSKTESHDSTPIAPLKSDPHDALIEEFKLRHQRAPSEVSSAVHHTGVPPPPPTVPPPAESDTESDVVTTMKVTQYEFDSHDVKHAVEHHHEHHEQHSEHNGHQHHHVEDHVVLHYEEPPHEHVKTFTHHDGLDSRIGHGAVGHHESDDEFGFEHVEYHDVHHDHHHEPEPVFHQPPSVVQSEPRSEVPAAFFHSPVIQRKAPPQQEHFQDADSDVSSHHHHHHQELHVHRELVPNLSGPHVREDLRPVNVVEEHRHVTVVKQVSAPVAHVSPVVSHHEKGLRRIDESHFTSVVEARHDEHEQSQQHHHHHHDHSAHQEQVETHYHKHDDQVEEVFSGPSVRDLKSRFEQGGEVKVHYGTHYISHHTRTSSAPPVHIEQEHDHHVEHNHDHHTHLEHYHDHQVHLEQKHGHHAEHKYEEVRYESAPVAVQSVPHLPHRELKDAQEVRVTGHTHKHHQEVPVKEHQPIVHHHYHHHHKQHSHPVAAVIEHKHANNEKHHKHHHHQHEASVKGHHNHHNSRHESLVEQHGHAEQHKHHHHNHEAEHHHHEEIHAVEHNAHHKEHQNHQEHIVSHHYEHTSVEEEQLPVSELLNRYGGGSKFRRPDHVEEIKIYSRSSSVPNIVEHHQEHHHHEHVEEHHKPRTVTQSSVTTVGNQSQSAYSVQSSHRRSHSSTINQEHHNHVQILSPIVVPAPVAAARSTSADHQSLRVVKSVRAFVSEWGQKDFRPPMSPIITVPRLPSSPNSPVAQTFPMPAARKSTMMSNVSGTTNQSYSEEHKAIQKIEQALRDDESDCSECRRHKKRPSAASVATTVTTTHTVTSHHQEPVHNHIGEGVVYTQVPEVHEEFVLTPLSERRAMFEQGLSRGYSINRKTHGELRPMVNVFTD